MRKVLAVLAFAALASSVSQAGAGGLGGWPFDVPAEVILAFGDAYSGDGEGSSVHRGVDLAADSGTRVRAVLAGTVTFAGSVPAGEGATMRAVTVESGDVRLSYMPFESLDAALGDRVEPGAPLGLLAASGDRSSSLPHLHIGARVGTLYVDPMSYLVPLVAAPSPESAPAPDGASVEAAAETPLPVLAQVAQSVTGAAAASAPAPVGTHSGVAAQTQPGIAPLQVTGTGAAATVPEAATNPALAPAQPMTAPDGMPALAHASGATAGAASGTLVSRRAEVAEVPGAEVGKAVSAPVPTAARASRSLAGGLSKGALTVLGCLCGCASLWPIWRAAGLLGDGVGALNEDVAAVGVR